MITNFKEYNLITENPDHINFGGEHYKCGTKETFSFSCVVNDKHTKLIKMLFSQRGEGHAEMVEDDADTCSYPGRIWTKSKIISFWVYPNEELFKQIINKLEEKFKLKMFDNGWRIEVVTDRKGVIKKKKFSKRADIYDYYLSNLNYKNSKLVPIEQYVGSQDFSDIQRKMHLMNWKEKQAAKEAGLLNMSGWGGDRIAYDQPKNLAYRQTVHQESKNE